MLWEKTRVELKRGSGAAGPLSCREARQGTPDFTFTQPLQRPIAQLTHSLAGDAQHATYFLERVLPSAVEPEVESQDFSIARCQRPQRGIDLLSQEVLHGPLFRVALLLGNEPIDHGALALLIEWRIQPYLAGIQRRQRAHHVHGQPGALRDLLVGRLPPEVLPQGL